MSVYRILDANINRASEGLRVLEDYARFTLNQRTLSSQAKAMRHHLRKSTDMYEKQLIDARNSTGDHGLATSREAALDQRSTEADLVRANFKRVQEALRSIEEFIRIAGSYDASKKVEELRFMSYELEKGFTPFLRQNRKTEKLSADLYCLTGEVFSQGRSNAEVARALGEAGIKLLQYREKDKSPQEKLKECMALREITRDYGMTFIVNDDITIAQLVGADGVHLGQEDIPLAEARKLLGEEMIIGISTHSPEQLKAAVDGGADYVGVGPVFRTFTKKDVCEPVGFDYLDHAVAHAGIPFVAIGGIKLHNLESVCRRGAAMVAMVTEIVGSEDIVRTVEEAREIMRRSKA